MLGRLLGTVLASILWLVAAPQVGAECLARQANACVLALQGAERPTASPSCTSDAWTRHLSFEHPERFVDSNGDGFWETVLEIDLTPGKGCNCVVFRTRFEGEPAGFSLNIGDSATNDGHGGDAGTDPIHSAELQLKTGRGEPTKLTVYAASGDAAGQDTLLALNLPSLAGRVLEIEICDQFLDFSIDGKREGPGAGWMRSRDNQRLFAVAAPADESGARDSPTMDPWIYAGFNRVIHDRRGAAAQKRTGRGVARVEIFLKP